MSLVQDAANHGTAIKDSITAIETAIDALPDGPDKTNLKRLTQVHHGNLTKLAFAGADMLRVPVTTLTGGTEKDPPPPAG